MSEMSLEKEPQLSRTHQINTIEVTLARTEGNTIEVTLASTEGNTIEVTLASTEGNTIEVTLASTEGNTIEVTLASTEGLLLKKNIGGWNESKIEMVNNAFSHQLFFPNKTPIVAILLAMNIWSKEIRIRAVEAYIRSNSIIFRSDLFIAMQELKACLALPCARCMAPSVPCRKWFQVRFLSSAVQTNAPFVFQIQMHQQITGISFCGTGFK
ncbi:hypothetical protein C0J52_08454 [Blattella germanica]|nr:hypothetical protein C0J52_08454 [Blattella germanica]